MRCSVRYTSIALFTLVLLVCYTLWICYQDNKYEAAIQDTLQSHVQSEHIKVTQSSTPSHDLHPGIIPWDDAQFVIKHLDIYDLTQPTTNQYQCVKMKTQPPTPICLYDEGADIYISHDLADTGLWEPHVFLDFLDVLKRDPDLGVIDIGANLGVYSLVPAQMGHKVVAVEPFIQSIQRFHSSAQLGNVTDKIVLLQNAVAERRTDAMIIRSGNNQGDTRIILGADRCAGSCPYKVRTILIDDLIPVISFNKAILKIDCQGYEYRAFKFAKKLLAKIDVVYIYMEWIVMKDLYHSVNKHEKESVMELIRSLLDHGYRPHSVDAHGAKQLDPNTWHTWPTDIVWRHLPNEQEYQHILKHHFMLWP